MKKTYFIPAMEIVEISTKGSLLVGSGNLGNGDVPTIDMNDVVPGGTGLPADAPGMLQDLLGLPKLPGVTL